MAHLSSDDFASAAGTLARASRGTWHYRQASSPLLGPGYLISQPCTLSSTSVSTLNVEDDDEDDDLLRLLEDAQAEDVVESADAERTCQAVTCVYHVTFSSSYRVPVLFIDATMDGQVLDVEAFVGAVVRGGVAPKVRDGWQVDDDVDKTWTFATQMTHPVLSRPMIALHPCKTAELMAVVLSEAEVSPEQFLVSWLSLVAPVVQLHVPLWLGKALQDS